VDWPPNWVAVDDPADKAGLEAELRRETAPGHVLADEAVSLLGRSLASDDCLYGLDDGRVAAVHLTWSVERNPDWPSTAIYPSFDAWAREEGAAA
jgi:hypothetical protein